MSSSNCCFLTCIQVSQEAGQVVWYSHLHSHVKLSLLSILGLISYSKLSPIFFSGRSLKMEPKSLITFFWCWKCLVKEYSCVKIVIISKHFNAFLILLFLNLTFKLFIPKVCMCLQNRSSESSWWNGLRGKMWFVRTINQTLKTSVQLSRVSYFFHMIELLSFNKPILFIDFLLD